MALTQRQINRIIDQEVQKNVAQKKDRGLLMNTLGGIFTTQGTAQGLLNLFGGKPVQADEIQVKEPPPKTNKPIIQRKSIQGTDIPVQQEQKEPGFLEGILGNRALLRGLITTGLGAAGGLQGDISLAAGGSETAQTEAAIGAQQSAELERLQELEDQQRQFNQQLRLAQINAQAIGAAGAGQQDDFSDILRGAQLAKAFNIKDPAQTSKFVEQLGIYKQTGKAQDLPTIQEKRSLFGELGTGVLGSGFFGRRRQIGGL